MVLLQVSPHSKCLLRFRASRGSSELAFSSLERFLRRRKCVFAVFSFLPCLGLHHPLSGLTSIRMQQSESLQCQLLDRESWTWDSLGYLVLCILRRLLWQDVEWNTVLHLSVLMHISAVVLHRLLLWCLHLSLTTLFHQSCWLVSLDWQVFWTLIVSLRRYLREALFPLKVF